MQFQFQSPPDPDSPDSTEDRALVRLWPGRYPDPRRVRQVAMRTRLSWEKNFPFDRQKATHLGWIDA